MDKSPMVFAFGGGNDGTAALIEFHRRGIRPDLILFADTGNRDSEKPGTYAHVDRMNEWCKQRFGVPIITVRNDGQYKTLENNCLSQHMLPSIAYGFKSCSDKYKIRPQHKYCQQWKPAADIWERGGKVQKVLGYNASEPHRKAVESDDLYEYWYPLIEWGITRPMVLDDDGFKDDRLSHAIRHLHLWADGDRSENHLAKVMWFCVVQIEYERMLSRRPVEDWDADGVTHAPLTLDAAERGGPHA